VRVLATTLPGYGHFHPMIPLCRAIAAAGHEVRVAVPRGFMPVVESAGLEALAAGPGWVEEEIDSFVPGFTAMQAPEQVAAWIDVAKRGVVDDLLTIAGAWEPDVIVHDHLDFSAWIAGELTATPNVPFAMTVRVLDPMLLDMLVGADIPPLLGHFGLPPDPKLVRPGRWLYLDALPPRFTAERFPPGPTVHPVRYETDDDTGPPAPRPTWLAELGSTPLVYVTLGTVFNRVPGLLATMAEGAAEHDVEVRVTTGRNADPDALGALPSNVHVERYVPQTLVLPQCRAVVCHGGFNTVFGALRCGVPLVVVPVSADQPLNAALCEQAGVGVACTTDQPPEALFPIADPAKITAGVIAAALGRVLQNPDFVSAADSLAEEIEAQPPVTHAVDLIERLVTTGEPVLRTP
jgi:UDP:flavonoid glycosyltransferase YjiC (YdhE family)